MPWLRSLCVLLLLAATACAEDWPQWLGPRRDGSSTEKISPWKEDPRVVWKKDVTAGHSSPVICKGVVYLHTKGKGDGEDVTAYKADDGSVIWTKSYDRGKFASQFGDGPRATPVCDGKNLYTFGVTGFLTAWDVKDGKQLWQVDTLKDFKAKNLTFGVSSSPIIEDDKIVVMVGGKGAAVVAFTREGKVAWKSEDDEASYASPMTLTVGKTKQVVFLTKLGLIGLKPGDGKLLWRVPFRDTINESSTTPVKIGDLLLGSSVTLGGIGLKLEETEKGIETKQAWKNGTLSCYFSTPVSVGEHVYMVTGSFLPPSCTLQCVEAKTGKSLWKKTNVGKYHAALMRTADDKLLMVDDGGNLTLIEPDAREFKPVAKSKVCGPTWAHPAMADGKLYLRDDKNVLMCLEFPK